MDPSQADYQEDEITLKELILGIRDYSRYLWTKKWWIIAVGLLGGLIGFYRAYTTPVTYTAELTFMVNEDEGSSMGGLGSILGQFGLGGAAASEYNLDKIVALSRSRKIINEVLLDSIGSAQQDLAGNHLIDIYELHEKWEKDGLEKYKSLYLKSNSPEDLSTPEREVLKILYNTLVGNKTKGIEGLLEVGYSEETGILKLIITTIDESLSVGIIEQVYKRLSEFYVSKSIEKQKTTLLNLESKADSVATELSQREYGLASLKDRSLGITNSSYMVRRDKLQREVQILSILYGEILKNKETASFVLSNKTPFFQVLDEPAMPLDASPQNYLLSIIKFLIATIFIAFVVAFLVWRISLLGLSTK